MRESENPNITEREKAKIQFKLYKMDNKPDWMMKVFIGACVVGLLITTIVLTQK